MSANDGPVRRPSVTALGGGHGLFASLSALRRLDVDISAVVTVADDGGSSGRIRQELDVLPPGDLRMAIAALASNVIDLDEDRLEWTELLQHRIGGAGALAGHPVGNLVLTGLLEMSEDPVHALDRFARMAGAVGRVLPMSCRPLDLWARVTSVDPDDPVRERIIRGQSSVAATAGRVRAVELVPAEPAACPEAVSAIRSADVVLLGPGSWFTSVVPHLLVPGLADALAQTSAQIVTILNLVPQPGETDGFSPEDHLAVLLDNCPRLHIDAVIADTGAVVDESALGDFVSRLGAQLVVTPVAAAETAARHDASLLAAAISHVISGADVRPAPAESDEQGAMTWR
jgi:uncharacterized cofD-like protein